MGGLECCGCRKEAQSEKVEDVPESTEQVDLIELTRDYEEIPMQSEELFRTFEILLEKKFHDDVSLTETEKKPKYMSLFTYVWFKKTYQNEDQAHGCLKGFIK